MSIRARRSIDNGGIPADSKSCDDDSEPEVISYHVKRLSIVEKKDENENVSSLCEKPTNLEDALRVGRLDSADHYWRVIHSRSGISPKNYFDFMSVAIQSGKLSTVRFLTERNVSVNCASRTGETPLHLAAKLGCLDIVEYLATAGADVCAVDCNQNTPLHVACTNGKSKSVMALCAVHADLNLCNDEQKTPLMCAVCAGHVNCARILLNAGARTDITDENGNSALHLATLHNDETMVQLLCKAHCDLDSKNLDGYNALNLAARLGFLSVVRVLLLYGADSKIKAPNGITPDVAAFAQGHKKVGMLLTKINPTKRKAWNEQLLNTVHLLPRIKLKIFGSTLTGKTQLTQSLKAGFLSAFLRKKLSTVSEFTGFTADQVPSVRRRPCMPYEWNAEIAHENYTRGFEVHTTNEYSLWDFSGYEPYYFLYDHFIGDTNCIHLVLFSLLDSPTWRRASVQFWLHFLYARIIPTKPLLFGGRSARLGRVILVGTHADCVQCARDTNGVYFDEDAWKMLQEVRQQFESKLEICQSVFLLNARDAMSLELKQLKSLLSDWRTEIVQALPRTNSLLFEVAALLPEWTSGVIFQADSWDRFAERVRENVNPLCSDEHVETLVQHLQYTGNIILIESPSSDNMIALSPHWLGTGVVGRSFSREAQQQARITGSYTVDDFQLSVREINTVKAVVLLEALGMCVCCVVQEEPNPDHLRRQQQQQKKKRRPGQDCAPSGDSDFFDQAVNHQSSGKPQAVTTKRTVSVYLAMELNRMRDQINKDDMQLEIPRFNLIRVTLPAWEHVSHPEQTRYLGFQLSAERGQLLHVIPRIQVHLRYILDDFFKKGRWNRQSEGSKPLFTRWEMIQMMNGFRLVIFEGAVEVVVALNRQGQVLQLLAHAIHKHVRKTFGLVHQMVHSICEHIHAICPSLLIQADPLCSADLSANKEEPATWESTLLIGTMWKLYKRSIQITTTPENSVVPQPVCLDEVADCEKQLVDDLFFGDQRLMLDSITSCYQLPITSLRFPVIHYLASVIESHAQTEAVLVDFFKALGLEDPYEYLSVFRRGQFAPHTPSLVNSLVQAPELQTITMETLIEALEVFKRIDLIQCVYHSHLLLRLFARKCSNRCTN